MPHRQRRKSETGFYHVVSKGDGGQVIFEGDSDRLHYLSLLAHALDARKANLHAYCLMSNHVHLLIEDREDELSELMKEINESYARYYAKKTGRVGHVFQGRFWSEPVGTDEHFLAVMRYIHSNPEPAGICRAKDYPWSSYRAYIGDTGEVRAHKAYASRRLDKSQDSPVVTTKLALSLLGGAEAFKNFSRLGGRDARPFPGSTLSNHIAPDELVNIALRILGRETLYGLKKMKPCERVTYFEQLSKAGFTHSEIARVTGIGQASISRALKKS